jgi:YfiH family protein
LIGWLEANWIAPDGVKAIATYRGEGVSRGTYASLNLGDHVGDSADDVLENRRRLRSEVDLPAEPHWLRQVHGIDVCDADGTTSGAADASISRQRGRVLAILTADCLPVLLTSDMGDVIGAAHAGWRGLSAGVIERTVEAMGIPAERLLAWFGPAIGPRHFEVGVEVREAFLAADPTMERAFQANERGRFLADLFALARSRLERIGVRQIFGGEYCTYADPDRFFSHRRDGVTGRQAALIWLENR